MIRSGYGSNARVFGGIRTRTMRPAPELREGDVRCCVCRNRTRLNPSGYLRSHRDLFGDDCLNRRVA